MCLGLEEPGLLAFDYSFDLFPLLILSHLAPATVASFMILDYAKLVSECLRTFVGSIVRPLPRYCHGSLSYFIQFLFKCHHLRGSCPHQPIKKITTCDLLFYMLLYMSSSQLSPDHIMLYIYVFILLIFYLLH